MTIEDERLTADTEAAIIQHQSQLEFLSHRKWRRLDGAPGETVDTIPIAETLVGRAIASYRDASRHDYRGRSMWAMFFETLHQDSHAALLRGDTHYVKATWENPGGNDSFYGFDGLSSTFVAAAIRENESFKIISAHRVYDNLLQLAVATGGVRMDYPEAKIQPPFDSIENILDLLDQILGFRIDFPNPYPFEYGLQTSRGVASYRAVQALFQAYQTKALIGEGLTGARVVEIGPGLGRAAYYCSKAGIGRYTMIDLPFSSVSQAMFLGTTLGEDKIRLNGEPEGAPIQILTPDALLNQTDRYDLAVNFDSLTEMDTDTMRAYITRICHGGANVFLSVNHEFNAVTVNSVLREVLTPNHRIDRTPYWMRRGYVQEIVNLH